MDQPVRTPKSVTLTLAAGFGLGAVCMAGVFSGHSPLATSAVAQTGPHVVLGKPQATLAGATTDGLPELRSLDASFRTLARVVGPAVVDIKAGRSSGDGRVMVSEGEGSGFLVSGDGWIITNDHVVDGAKTVTVTLKDGRTYEGKVTSSNDDSSDIAVVKIDAKSLPYLTFSDSTSVEPGEFAMAVGAPFGLENTVTIGHVSALGRTTNIGGGSGMTRRYSDLIQTDAAINMGNSGGPLVNIDGQVIGMNTAIYSPTGGSNGIGFAIPSNQVRLIADLLMTKGKLTRGMIGVGIEDVKEFERTGLIKDGGARVTSLLDEGAAKVAGLKEGDVIVKVGDRPIRSATDLRNSMLAYPPNATVPVRFVRSGATKTVSLKLKTYAAPADEQSRPTRRRGLGGGDPLGDLRRQFPGFGGGEGDESDPFNLKEDATPGAKPETRAKGEPAHLGVRIADADETVRTQFGLPKDVAGAVVVSVDEGSIASSLGLRPGDVIQNVGGKTISDGQQLKDAMASVKWGDHVQVKTLRYKDGAKVEETRSIDFK